MEPTNSPVQDILALKQKPPTPQKRVRNVGRLVNTGVLHPMEPTDSPVQNILALKQKPFTPKKFVRNVGPKKDDLTEIGRR